MTPYVPEPGDIVWLSFDPQAGHEQAGTRPGLLVSQASFNQRTEAPAEVLDRVPNNFHAILAMP